MQNKVIIIPLSRKEYKNLSVSYFLYETDYGLSLIASTSQGVCHIGFGEKELILNDLKSRYKGAKLEEKQTDFQKLALRFIENKTVDNIPLHISGTDFQFNVWNALLQIPLGKLSSYKKIAEAIHKPKAVRAVGNAVGNNPVSYIIPCHRVIRSNRDLGGYFWGLHIKKKMLEKEQKLIIN